MSGEMTEKFGVDISGIEVRFSNVSPEIAGCFRSYWSSYLTAGDARPMIDGTVRVEGEPFSGKELSVKSMNSRFAAGRATFSMMEGSVSIDSEGQADFIVAPASEQIMFFAIVNLLLAALAWIGPRSGIVVIHSAGIVLDESAFLLVGAEDAGKTTWAELSEKAGARVISDDVVIVDLARDRVMALGSPYRRFGVAQAGLGRWPVSAILLPVHGDSPGLAPVSSLAGRARIIANLTFVNELIGVNRDLDNAVDRIVKTVPFRELTFAKDSSFVPILRRFGMTAGDS